MNKKTLKEKADLSPAHAAMYILEILVAEFGVRKTMEIIKCTNTQANN